MPTDVLPLAYFRRPALEVARDLLGAVLVSHAGGQTVRLRVTETEAYHQSERGAHTYGGKRTPRTEVMFHAGGKAYTFFVYGMHWQFNVVTGQAETGEAVLIRAGVPLADSVDVVRQRRFADRKAPKNLRKWCDGPGKLCQAAGITGALGGTEFLADQPAYFERGVSVPDADVLIGPRVGIAYAGEDALLPWRFRVRPEASLPEPR
jgi:DNA-3-methyladenine glycosylase